jgi:GntR family transcriptional regulator, transcriptional repressor for pyruvate dehydrogenase complex
MNSGEKREVPARRLLSAGVAERLGEGIANGTYATGSRLPSEQELADGYGVSRTVVREAVARLSAGGRLESRQGAGVFVRTGPGAPAFNIARGDTDDPDELEALYELRLAVETEMAGLAAERRTPADVVRLTHCLEEWANEQAGDNTSMALESALYSALAQASGNDYFRRFVAFLGNDLQRLVASDGPTKSRSTHRSGGSADADRAALVAAVIRGDATAARAAARRRLKHMLSSWSTSAAKND